MPVAHWGRIAHPDFDRQRVKGVYFFAGDWKSDYRPVRFTDEPSAGPNDGLYTVHPADGRHLGWSVKSENRQFAMQEIVRCGANVVVMSYWGEPGTDRWRYWAPMQTSPKANHEVFTLAVDQPLLVMPAIEGGAATDRSPAFEFADEFPFTPPAQAQLVAQIRGLIRRYITARDKRRGHRWLQLYDQTGVPRHAVYVIHVGSTHNALQPDRQLEFSEQQHAQFAAGFDAIAEEIRRQTKGVRIGFVLDALVRPVVNGRPARHNYTPVSAYPECGVSGVAALLNQQSILAIQGFIPEISLSAERGESDRLDLKNKYLRHWRSSGIPVMMDLTVGYDGHLVFPPDPHTPTAIYGNNASWERGLLKLHPDDFTGVVFNTWNGYTEGYAVVPTTEHAEAAFRWVQRVFRKWFDLLPGIRTGGNSITALWQKSPLVLRLFMSGFDGAIWMTWWEPGRDWTVWKKVPSNEAGIPLQPGAEVTAIWREMDRHFDLFATGTDGAVWSIWWNPTVGWRPEGWILIRPEVKMTPGATVTALWRDPGHHLDLFSTGTDGAVWTIWWNDTVGWRPEGWILVRPEVKMKPGVTVTALWRDPGHHLDLFSTGTDGAVWTIWWNDTVGWRPEGWILVRPEVKMKPGATVTALWRDPGHHLDLFSTGTDGAVWTIWWNDTVGWRPEGWILVRPEVKMKPGATVTALWRDPGHHLDLFSTGTDGAVWTIWWNDTVGWRPDGWIIIGDVFTVGPGRTITAVWSPAAPLDHLDLFTIGREGQVVSAYWEPDLGW